MTTQPPTGPAARLRLEVGRFRARESRRAFDSSVQLGVLAGERAGIVVPMRDRPALDVALRTDVVSRLLEETPAPWRTLWFVRPGTPDPHDEDNRWLAAARTAFAMHDRPLDGCFVVTRSGWRDVVSGESRTWVRLRVRADA